MNATNRQTDTISTQSAARAAFPGGSAAAGGSGLDCSRLENVRPKGDKTIARCPACSELDGDREGDHLFIDARGRFGCVKHPGPAGADHRRRIFALAGATSRSGGTFGWSSTIPVCKSERTKRTTQTWPDADTAARACTPDGFTLVAVYRYQNGATARYENADGKTFRQFHPDGDGWALGAPPADPWSLFGVASLPAEGCVYVAEGEKCAEAAASIGLHCVTSAGGSSAAAKSDWSPLAGRDVVIIPDHDEPGERYAADVARILAGLNPPARVRIVRLPGLPSGGDVADWIDGKGESADPEAMRAEIELLAATVAEDATTGALDGADVLRDALVSIVELADQPIDHGETLIGAGDCRYLERGAVLLLAAPSGTGKSHLAAQAAVSWGCGRSAFGLEPTNPLRCLVVQAENPPNDARQIAANMLIGLDLGPNQRELVDANTRQIWLPGCTGTRFLSQLESLLTTWPADLVFIDPLAGFADGDLVRPEVVQAFCRSGLGRLAVDHRCALFVCHHVPKPNANRDPARMGAYDFQYAGAGSADLAANWPRAVLTLQPLARGEFILRAAKRRPPWTNDNGSQAWEIGLRHTERGTWEVFETDPETARTGRPKSPDPATFKRAILELVGKSGPMPKTALVQSVRAITGGRDTARAAVELAAADGSLATWHGTGRGGCAMLGLPSQAPKSDGIKA